MTPAGEASSRFYAPKRKRLGVYGSGTQISIPILRFSHCKLTFRWQALT